jgi:hypothetical protein
LFCGDEVGEWQKGRLVGSKHPNVAGYEGFCSLVGTSCQMLRYVAGKFLH